MWRLFRIGGLTPALQSLVNPQSAQQMAFIRSVMKEQRKRSLHELSLDTLEAVVFDLETTGFSPYSGDEIISIGAVAVAGNRLLEDSVFYTLVNPKRTIPEPVCKLTGISGEMAGSAPGIMEALQAFLKYVRHRVLIAHGTGHDKPFLNSALWRTSRIHLSHRVIDTMMVARWLHPDLPGRGLDEMLAFYGIEAARRHHALEDARATALLWSRMHNELKERGIASLGDLYTALGSR